MQQGVVMRFPFVVILAGGSGQRLWPLSHKESPKQLIQFLDGRSLLQHTLDRVSALTKKDNVIIVTHSDYVQVIKEHVGHVVGRILAEPACKNTAPAVLLALRYIQEQGEDAQVIIIPADHFVPQSERFLQTLAQAVLFSQNHNQIAILGAKPSYPATGYGYVQAQYNELFGGYAVVKFHEKPNEATARSYLERGDMWWNMGIFAGRVSVFLEEFSLYVPQLFASLSQSNMAPVDYNQLQSISIDYAVMEKSNRLVVFPFFGDWFDVGNVRTFLDIQQKYGMQGVHNLINVHGHDNSVLSKKKIVACVGVSDLCVIETDDALLIVSKNDVESVKDVVGRLHELS